jgi:predicted CopG family antitoxin
VHVASRTISLSTDAYEMLRREKRPEESFSDVVRRLVRKPNPLDYVGAWAEVPDAEVDRMKRDIKAWRRSGDGKLRKKLAKWGR